MTTQTQTNWAVFPLTHKGINFQSRIDMNSSVYNQIMALPEGVFLSMNKSMLDELTTINEESTYDEIVDQLDIVNAGGSYAFIELAE